MTSWFQCEQERALKCLRYLPIKQFPAWFLREFTSHELRSTVLENTERKAELVQQEKFHFMENFHILPQNTIESLFFNGYMELKTAV